MGLPDRRPASAIKAQRRSQPVRHRPPRTAPEPVSSFVRTGIISGFPGKAHGRQRAGGGNPDRPRCGHAAAHRSEGPPRRNGLLAEGQKEEAEQARVRERRERAVERARAALEKAQREHEAKATVIEGERRAIEKRAQAEEARWEKQRENLQGVRRAQEDEAGRD